MWYTINKISINKSGRNIYFINKTTPGSFTKIKLRRSQESYSIKKSPPPPPNSGIENLNQTVINK